MRSIRLLGRRAEFGGTSVTVQLAADASATATIADVAASGAGKGETVRFAGPLVDLARASDIALLIETRELPGGTFLWLGDQPLLSVRRDETEAGALVCPLSPRAVTAAVAGPRIEKNGRALTRVISL